MSSGQRRTVPSVAIRHRVFRTWDLTRTMSLRLAQWGEHQTEDLEVTGSTPVPTTNESAVDRQTQKASQRSGPREAGICRISHLSTSGLATPRSQIGYGQEAGVAKALFAIERWQQEEAPCSAWIPLSPVAERRLPELASNRDRPRPNATWSTDAVESRPR